VSIEHYDLTMLKPCGFNEFTGHLYTRFGNRLTAHQLSDFTGMFLGAQLPNARDSAVPMLDLLSDEMVRTHCRDLRQMRDRDDLMEVREVAHRRADLRCDATG